MTIDAAMVAKQLQAIVELFRPIDRMIRLPGRLSGKHLPLVDLRAIKKLRALSADEATLLLEAREERRQEGRQEGEQVGLQKGRQEAARETAGHLIELDLLNDVQIAPATGLSLAQIEALRANRTP